MYYDRKTKLFHYSISFYFQGKQALIYIMSPSSLLDRLDDLSCAQNRS